jgi:hypothetical protein
MGIPRSPGKLSERRPGWGQSSMSLVARSQVQYFEVPDFPSGRTKHRSCPAGLATFALRTETEKKAVEIKKRLEQHSRKGANEGTDE